MPSEDTKEGKEEEAKLELTFFAKCQKEREEEKPEDYCICDGEKSFYCCEG